MSLRDELAGEPDVPDYAVVLPSGWVEHTASTESEHELLRLVTDRLRSEHRPDLLVQHRALAGRAFAGLRGARVHRVYLQTAGWGGLVAPMSITAAVRSAPRGATLDGVVADLVRRGATSLHGDKRFVRATADASTAVGTRTVRQRTISYLTPYADRRTHALQFTTVIARPDESAGDAAHELFAGFEQLSDAIIASFAWRRHAA